MTRRAPWTGDRAWQPGSAFSGRYARAIRNDFTEQYARSGAPVLPFFWLMFAAGDIFQAAARREDAEYLPLWAGQSVGLVQSLPTAAQVVSDTIAQAHRLLSGSLAATVTLD
jgi:nitronate monooxygenase